MGIDLHGKIYRLEGVEMYRNEINEMEQSELATLVEEKSLAVDVEEYIDSDEVIELLQKEDGTIFESAEDDILDTIMNGNWSYAVEQMMDLNVYPDSLVDYINDYRYEVFDEAYEWFSLESAVAITELFYKTRKVA